MKGTASFVMLFVMGLSSAQAMDYSYRHIGPHRIMINASGMIEKNEGEIFVQWVKKYVNPDDEVDTFVLNSRGGSVNQALRLAKVIDHFQINTSVPAGGVCASACVLVWSAGHEKSVSENSALGVHEAYLDIDAPAETISPEGTNFEVKFLKKEGAPKHVIDKLKTTEPPDVYILTKDDLINWNTHIVKD